jgi:hypothetical protein
MYELRRPLAGLPLFQQCSIVAEITPAGAVIDFPVTAILFHGTQRCCHLRNQSRVLLIKIGIDWYAGIGQLD